MISREVEIKRKTAGSCSMVSGGESSSQEVQEAMNSEAVQQAVVEANEIQKFEVDST